MTLKLITFKTNHTILGETNEQTAFVEVTKPVQVVSIPPSPQNPNGGVAFAPFLEYCDEFKTGIRIERSDILTMTTPVRDLENQYNQIFGSGITIASSIPKM